MSTIRRLSTAYYQRMATLAAQLIKQRAEIKARVERRVAA